MTKEQIIEKIMGEYKTYGLTKEMTEIIYNLAVKFDVPNEMIYEGMRYLCNNQFEIDDITASEGVVQGTLNYSVNDSMRSNPGESRELISKNIACEILEEGTEKLSEGFANIDSKFQEIAKDRLKKFVKEHI